VFAELDRGEAVIYSPEGQQADRTHITPVHLQRREPERINPQGPRHRVEINVHPETIIPIPPPRTDEEAPHNSGDPPSESGEHPFNTI
jgi:hypothetical protein